LAFVSAVGYQLIDADDCRLWFSIDGIDNSSHRDILMSFEDERKREDLVANSADPWFIGAIAIGWKSGSLMLMRLTHLGMHYQPKTEAERTRQARSFVPLPTPEEIEGIDALILELTTGEKSAASERLKDKYVQGVDEELAERRSRRMLEKPGTSRAIN
jgi:hypothetical protein